MVDSIFRGFGVLLALFLLVGCVGGGLGGSDGATPTTTATNSPVTNNSTTSDLSEITCQVVDVSFETKMINVAAEENGDSNNTRTPTTVMMPQRYIDVTVSSDTSAVLKGNIYFYNGSTELVEKEVKSGTNEFTFGPYEDTSVDEYEFWVESC